MFHIECKISGDRIKEPMTNLALLNRLGFLQELDICHYTGKIFVWSEIGVKILVGFHHFCRKFPLRMAGASVNLDPFPGKQHM